MAEITKWKPKLTGEVESFKWTEDANPELLKEFVDWYMGYDKDDYDRQVGADSIPDMIYDSWKEQVLCYGLSIIDRTGSRISVSVGDSIVRHKTDDYQVWSPMDFESNYVKVEKND